MAACPTCGTDNAADATQCVQCKQVFGEENRCGACGAIAAASETADNRLVCAACGAPRQRRPGTVVMSRFGDELKQQARTSLILSWVARLGAIGAGLLGAAAGGLQSLFDLGSPALTAGVFLAGAVGLFFVGGRQRAKSLRLQDEALSRQLLSEVGQARRGMTAAGVARRLDVSEEQADEGLEVLAKRGQVEMDVDDAGTIRYRVGGFDAPLDGLDELDELDERGETARLARPRD